MCTRKFQQLGTDIGSHCALKPELYGIIVILHQRQHQMDNSFIIHNPKYLSRRMRENNIS